MDVQGWLALAAIVLAAAALAGVLWLYVRLRPHRPAVAERPGRRAPSSSEANLVAFVVNPTKSGATGIKDAAVRACAARYLPEPLILETTRDDPGVGQARAAIDAGASTVVAVGGDGTVRAVAEALVGTGVAMGIVPLGTGNLLARNLDLPLAKTDELLRIAVTGRPRAVDVGWLEVGPGDANDDDDGDGTARGDHLFLVIAGLGFDAAMVESTDEELKSRVGWLAYFVAGAQHLGARRHGLSLQLDGAEPVTVRARSLLVGNCGRLPGGLTLLPDAEIDDGWLDIAAIDTRGGIVGWVQLFGEVVLQGVGVRNELPGRIGRIDHARGRRLRVVADQPVQVQVDGDSISPALELSAWVDPGALVVRVA